MVYTGRDAPPDPAQHPERQLILTYAPADARGALAALFALDDALALLLRTTREPALGQLRLAWWREALAKLDVAPPPAEPVLQGLAGEVLSRGVSGGSLVPIVHGWEVLVEEAQLDAEPLTRFAQGRVHLFTAGGMLLGARPSDPLVEAGQGWALADLSRNLGADAEAEAARTSAASLLAAAVARKWSAQARSLGALAHLARLDLDLARGEVAPVGSPSRVARLLWHRLTGR